MNGIITSVIDDGETILIDDMPVHAETPGALRRWLLAAFGTVENDAIEGTEVIYDMRRFTTIVTGIALA